MATVVLTVPGITNSSEGHWQSLWERQFPDKFRRIEQAEWNEPKVEDWIAKIEHDVRKADPKNVVIAAHSLGCVAVAYWAGRFRTVIKGALLVAPSDCEAEKYRATYASSGFDPVPNTKLPFKSIVAASTNDEWVAFDRAKQFADSWGSDFVNVGDKGHINGFAGFGEWNEGLELLRRFE